MWSEFAHLISLLKAIHRDENYVTFHQSERLKQVYARRLNTVRLGRKVLLLWDELSRYLNAASGRSR